ncbi:MAG TPA: cell division protein FtsQ/DivIB [Usitatibacter sp.]|nr:cell division protein FtsQ/DivIB [Usitatibacter sp.]
MSATAAAVVAAALAAGAWYAFDAISSQPIREVTFAGDVGRVSRAGLDAFAHSVQGASQEAASLEAVREAARRIPWVREASVRRRFPDAVELTLDTYEPLARWGDASLVSTRGEVFSADYKAFLPRFRGPEGSAARIAAMYPAIAKALAPLASAVTDVNLTPRGAWQVALESGFTLEAGHADVEARLQRFAAAWPQLGPQAVAGGHADLRYANGFALRKAATTR